MSRVHTRPPGRSRLGLFRTPSVYNLATLREDADAPAVGRGRNGCLVVAVQAEGFGFAHVVFDDPLGFRVLDEAELGEIWDTYSEPNGWLWEVEGGGWLELEAQREWFKNSLAGIRHGLREFMLVDDACINVLCFQPPRVDDLVASPVSS